MVSHEAVEEQRKGLAPLREVRRAVELPERHATARFAAGRLVQVGAVL